jgi:hypothetical protein
MHDRNRVTAASDRVNKPSLVNSLRPIMFSESEIGFSESGRQNKLNTKLRSKQRSSTGKLSAVFCEVIHIHIWRPGQFSMDHLIHS